MARKVTSANFAGEHNRSERELNSSEYIGSQENVEQAADLIASIVSAANTAGDATIAAQGAGKYIYVLGIDFGYSEAPVNGRAELRRNGGATLVASFPLGTGLSRNIQFKNPIKMPVANQDCTLRVLAGGGTALGIGTITATSHTA